MASPPTLFLLQKKRWAPLGGTAVLLSLGGRTDFARVRQELVEKAEAGNEE